MGEKKYQVSISRRGARSTKETIKEAFDRLGGLGKYIQPGQKIMIKPNYTGDLSPYDGSVTSTAAQEGMIQLLNDYGVTDITIAEGCGTVHIGTSAIYEHVGLKDVAERCGVKLVDMNTCPMRDVSIPEAVFLKEVKLSEALFGYDMIINMPVIKTHVQCVFTCAVKNMKGAVSPKGKRYFHATELHQCIADFQLALPRNIVVVDGLIAQEGMGPAEGSPVPLDIIMVGENPVAIDGVAMAIAQVDPEEVKHVVLAAQMGQGSYHLEDIEVLGVPIEKLTRKFKPAITEVGSYEGVELYTDNSCSGCTNSLVIALNRMKNCGDLPKFKDLQIKCGTGVPSCKEYKNMFYLGKCAHGIGRKEAETRQNVYLIDGCAPSALEIEERIREAYGIDRQA